MKTAVKTQLSTRTKMLVALLLVAGVGGAAFILAPLIKQSLVLGTNHNITSTSPGGIPGTQICKINPLQYKPNDPKNSESCTSKKNGIEVKTWRNISSTHRLVVTPLTNGCTNNRDMQYKCLGPGSYQSCVGPCTRQPSCIDPDGRDLTVKRTATFTNAEGVQTTKEDKCDEDGNILEAFCSNSTTPVAYILQTCPANTYCVDGACDATPLGTIALAKISQNNQLILGAQNEIGKLTFSNNSNANLTLTGVSFKESMAGNIDLKNYKIVLDSGIPIAGSMQGDIPYVEFSFQKMIGPNQMVQAQILADVVMASSTEPAPGSVNLSIVNPVQLKPKNIRYLGLPINLTASKQ